MYKDAREFIEALGGYRKVALRLSMQPTTLHTHVSNGRLPAQWFDALCELAREQGATEPQRSLFSFKALPDWKNQVNAA